MRKFILAALLLGFSMSLSAQDFSNKGKEFWLAYSYHVGMVNTGGSPSMKLYLTSDVATTYNVEVFGGPNILSGNISANQVVTVTIPNNIFIDGDGPFANKAIHVTAAKPIVVYSFITRNQASAATLCLPTNVLGKEYYGMSFTQNSNEANSCSYITIVAVEDNTTVEIIPKAATKGGWVANTQHNINMNKGDVYQVLGTTSGNSGVDLSGTSVKAIANGFGGCKRIAVFSGTGKIAIGCSNGSADNLYQQLYPATSWGRKYLTVPSYNRPYTFYRVIKNDPATNVYVNGAQIPAASFTNGYYQFNTSFPNMIEGDGPISVTQYFTSQSCLGNGTPYDPDMVVLNPVEQNISKVTLVNSPLTANGAQEHHIQVIIKNQGTAVSSLKFDGNPVTGNFVGHLQDPSYFYVYIPNVSANAHTLSSDSGFNALAYGYGQAESYAYSAGTNVRDLYQQIGVNSQYGIESTPSVCKGSPFRFKVSLPYLADSLYWDLSSLPAPTPANVLVKYPPTGIDSTTIVNGKTIYWYSLPTPYTINTVGTYPITITAYSPTAIGGCGTTQDIDFDLEVSAPPVAGFTFVSNGCVGSPIQFVDTTAAAKPTYKWDWEFGDPASGASNRSTLKNPTHIYTTPGQYTVTFSTITTPGCLSDTLIRTSIINVSAIPLASFALSSPICAGAPVTFNNTSTMTGPGMIVKWDWNFGDGNTATATSLATASQLHTYPIWGPAQMAWLTTESNTGCRSKADTVTFKVNPIPFVDFQLPGGICLPGASQFSSLSTIADGTQSTFTYLWNFGDVSSPNNTSATNPTSHIYTAAPPTGGYQVNLKITSAAGCSHDSTKAVTSVFPKPLASYTAPAPVCTNTAMSFTSGVAPASVTTFWWDFGDGSPFQSSSSATLSHTYTTTNTFTVRHWIISSDGCYSDTVSHTVSTSPIPVISGVTHTNPTTCTGSNGTITLSGLVSGTSYTVKFDKNTVAQTPQVLIAGAGGIVIISGLTAGSYSNINVTAACTSNNAPTEVLTDPTPPAAPTATATPSLCEGANISLNASPTITGGIYAWTGPNSFSSGIQNPTIIAATLAAGGAYTVTVTQNGCLSAVSSPATVTVNPTPVISGAAPTNPTSCGGNNGFITVSGLVAGTSYTINYQKNSSVQPTLTLTASAGGTVVIPNLTAGSYGSIMATANGCTSTAAPVVSLSDPSAPAAPTVNPVASICAGSTLNLNASSGSAGAVYTWSGPNLFSSSLQNPSIPNATTAAGGSYSVFVTVANCVSPSTVIPVKVNDLPLAKFSFTAPLCETKTVSFTDASTVDSGLVDTWAWSFGDATTDNDKNPTHSYLTAGNYTVTLTVKSNTGCSSTAPVASPASQNLAVSVNPKAGFIIPKVCVNDVSATFVDTSKIAAGAIDPLGYYWDFGDTPGPLNTATTKDGVHKYNTPGPKTVTHVVRSANGCTDTVRQTIIINSGPPTADFTVTNQNTLCSKDIVEIINKSSVNIGVVTKLEIFWDNVNAPLPAGPAYELDNNPVLNKAYTHKYPTLQTTQNYSVRMRAYSGDICIHDKITVITVNATPKVQFNAIPDVCYDAAPFQITQASETGAVPGTSVFSGPGVSASGMFDPVVAGIGTWTINYTYTGTGGGCTDAASRTITVLDTAYAMFTVSAARCENRAITFTDNTTPAAGTTLATWTWDFGDGTGPIVRNNATPFTHTYPLTGTYTVTLRVTSNNGCRSSIATQQVIVSAIPHPNFIMPVACLPNANVTFTNQTAPNTGMTYLWDFSDPASGSNSSTAVNGNHIYNGNGPFTVTLKATSDVGCDSSFSRNYIDLHPQPHADFTVSAPAGVCLGSGVTFTNQSTGADGVVNAWSWDLDDGSPVINQTIASTPINYTFTDTLVYNVKLSITNSLGCKDDTTVQFKVHAFPVVNAGPDRVVLEGGTITLQPVVTGTDLQYLWSPATFLNNPAAATPLLVKPTQDMTYTLTVTAKGGCSASDMVNVKLLKFPIIPNTFTPNGDGINDTWRIDYLDTYPGNRVQVFNRYGQLIFESHGYSAPWNGTYKGKGLPVGTYYYIIEPMNGRAPITGYVTLIK